MNKILEINIKIILITFIVLILICTFFSNNVYADPPGHRPQDDNKNNRVLSEDFNTDDWNPSSSTQHEEQKLKEIGNKIIGTVQVIGSLVSVIAIIFIGIRYMIGSTEEKAQYKETMGPYLIGAVLVFGITATLKIVYDIAQSLN